MVGTRGLGSEPAKQYVEERRRRRMGMGPACACGSRP